MIKLTKEEKVCAIGKECIIQFPDSETMWLVLDVFNTGTAIKYVVINENLYYSVITLNIETGEYSNPEKVIDLMAALGELRNSLNNQ